MIRFENHWCSMTDSRPWLLLRAICAWLLLGRSPAAAFADPTGIEVVKPTAYRVRIVLKIEADKENLTRINAKCPLPCDWREQKVKLLSETVPPGSKSGEQTVKGLGNLWIVSCPKLAAGRNLTFERVYEIERFQVVSRFESKPLTRPMRETPEIRRALGDSPGIRLADPELRRFAEELAKDHETPWEYARAASDWIRNNVRYQLGDYRGAKFAFEKKLGDCEDLSALFIALCRISEIPARTVWVEGHAYPEFYLEDGRRGYWVPVQLFGPEEFGSIRETRPILQKGDRYREPMTRQTVRYLPQQAIAYGGKAGLSVARTILQPESEDSKSSDSARE